MQSRLTPGLRIRPDKFGGLCYVPSRDDFFALAHDVYRFIKECSTDWQEVRKPGRKAIESLAHIGVVQTRNPTIKEGPYSGPSFIGVFPEIPTVEEPLVINCFCTAHCPLRCVYCHADDLMKSFRDDEQMLDLDNVVATASMIPAMVAVITGGDPLSRPERAEALIKRLGHHKAIVLDTSGVGNIRELLPVLRQTHAHVRVSLDAISPVNDQLRPINSEYVPKGTSSAAAARQCIHTCLDEGIPVTVQTVISSRNENPSEWADLRDTLVAWGVRHWVIHLAVRGGSARRIENEADKSQLRKRGILPSPRAYSDLHALVRRTISDGIPIDIRVTDTGNTPNSVLLIGSKGDLFTEGYAHNGKVQLYSAGNGRPDLVRSLWPHLDRFGHARRYLNWNPWFYANRSLEEVCYLIDVPIAIQPETDLVVETEGKFSVLDASLITTTLTNAGFRAGKTTLQRDEYYDNSERSLGALDFVVRLRRNDGDDVVALKGPRFYTSQGDYSRIELEFQAKSLDSVRADCARRGLVRTWTFEKRRTRFVKAEHEQVFLDEIPELGYYLEIEGSISFVRQVSTLLGAALGSKEKRNYAELFLSHKESHGVASQDCDGAEFPHT